MNYCYYRIIDLKLEIKVTQEPLPLELSFNENLNWKPLVSVVLDMRGSNVSLEVVSYEAKVDS